MKLLKEFRYTAEEIEIEDVNKTKQMTQDFEHFIKSNEPIKELIVLVKCGADNKYKSFGWNVNPLDVPEAALLVKKRFENIKSDIGDK